MLMLTSSASGGRATAPVPTSLRPPMETQTQLNCTSSKLGDLDIYVFYDRCQKGCVVGFRAPGTASLLVSWTAPPFKKGSRRRRPGQKRADHTFSSSSGAVSWRQAAEANVLHLQVLVDAVLGAFGAQAGLFHPPKQRLRGRQQPLVDSNHPHLQRLGHTPDLTHVLREEVPWGATTLVRLGEEGLAGYAGTGRTGLVRADSPARPMLEAFATATASSSVSNLRRESSACLTTSASGARQSQTLRPTPSMDNITLQETHSHMPATLPVSSYPPDNGHQRPKRLLLHAQHVGGDVGKQGGLHERAFQTSPACYQLCSLRNGI